MTAPRLTRREIVLVALTALVCFAIAIPLTSASSDRASRQFTVWPGNDARFANLDWNCHYYTARKGIDCGRESTDGGVQLEVTGEQLWVVRCKVTPASKPTDCTKNLLIAKRNP